MTKNRITSKPLLLIMILIALMIISSSLTSCSGRAWYTNGKYYNGFPAERSCAAFSNPQYMKKSTYNRQAYDWQGRR